MTVREYQEELGYGRSTGAVATQVAVGVTQISNVGASMGAVVPIHHHHQQQQHSLPPWQQMSGIEMVNGAGQHVSNASLQDQYMRYLISSQSWLIIRTYSNFEVNFIICNNLKNCINCRLTHKVQKNHIYLCMMHHYVKCTPLFSHVAYGKKYFL